MRHLRKLSFPTEEPLDEIPHFVEEPLRRAREEKNGHDRGEIGQNVDAEEGHGFSPLQKVIQAASAATT